ncbi:hypothetical protein, partial [Klebsiella pneumoniae]|uniref:hypothetical protein n=1 Tax=Klebsiella pneumoniae TaxID=573 RepID=UPI001C642C76
KRAYCLKTQPATGETYPKSDLFNKAPFSVLVNPMDLENVFCQIDSNSFNVHDSSAPFNE